MNEKEHTRKFLKCNFSSNVGSPPQKNLMTLQKLSVGLHLQEVSHPKTNRADPHLSLVKEDPSVSLILLSLECIPPYTYDLIYFKEIRGWLFKIKCSVS